MFFEYIILASAFSISQISAAAQNLKQRAPVEQLGFNDRGLMLRTPRPLTNEERALSGAILHTIPA